MENFDQVEFRQALGKFATGITVVTTTSKLDKPVGITVNSFTSVSLEPPLILWCLDNSAESYDVFANCNFFAVHVLHHKQEPVSQLFAMRNGDKFADVEWVTGKFGSPILQDCSACLQCGLEATYAGGDHLIILGRVRKIESIRHQQPLLYHAGAYRTLRDD